MPKYLCKEDLKAKPEILYMLYGYVAPYGSI